MHSKNVLRSESHRCSNDARVYFESSVSTISIEIHLLACLLRCGGNDSSNTILLKSSMETVVSSNPNADASPTFRNVRGSTVSRFTGTKGPCLIDPGTYRRPTGTLRLLLRLSSSSMTTRDDKLLLVCGDPCRLRLGVLSFSKISEFLRFPNIARNDWVASGKDMCYIVLITARLVYS